MTTSKHPNQAMSGPLFIVFEGLDGSGKSTSAKLLAEKLDAVFITTPSGKMRSYRDRVITDLGHNQEAHQLFYLATVFAASAHVQELLAQGRSVVIDRYFLSTQAYAEFRGSTLALDEVESQLLPAHMTVYLDVPLHERRRRLATRATTAADAETLNETADTTLRKTHAARFNLPVVGRVLPIAAACLSPDQIAALVMADLQEI